MSSIEVAPNPAAECFEVLGLAERSVDAFFRARNASSDVIHTLIEEVEKFADKVDLAPMFAVALCHALIDLADRIENDDSSEFAFVRNGLGEWRQLFELIASTVAAPSEVAA